MQYHYTRAYRAHLGHTQVIVPDEVADDQRMYASDNVSFPALRLDGRKVTVRIDGLATGLWTPGTGDLVVRKT